MSLTLFMTGYGFSQRRCRDAVTWFMRNYLPRHQITLEVLHRGLKRESVMGWCDIEGRTYKPRSFLIEIQSGLDEESYLTVLMHELHHCYQFVKGDLSVKSSKPYYKGVCIEGINYEDLEHEKEAYQMEKELLHQYKTYLTS